MIHVWLLYHRRHGLLHRPIPKFKIRMLVPDLLQVKVRSIQTLLEECDSASMSHAGCRYFEAWVTGDDEVGRRDIRITVYFQCC